MYKFIISIYSCFLFYYFYLIFCIYAVPTRSITYIYDLYVIHTIVYTLIFT